MKAKLQKHLQEGDPLDFGGHKLAEWYYKKFGAHMGKNGSTSSDEVNDGE